MFGRGVGEGEETVGVVVGEVECVVGELVVLEVVVVVDLVEVVEVVEVDQEVVELVVVDLELVELDVELETFEFGVHEFCPPTTEQRLPAGQQKVKPAHGTADLSVHGVGGALCHCKKSNQCRVLLDLGLEGVKIRANTHFHNNTGTTIPLSTTHNFSLNIDPAHVSWRTAATFTATCTS